MCRMNAKTSSYALVALLGAVMGSQASWARQVYMSPEANKVEHDSSVFRPDAQYPERPYDVEAQLNIYGNKRANHNPRPLLELGRRIYDTGLFKKPSYALGKKNPINHQFTVYGDIRFAMGSNDDGSEDRADLLAVKTTIDVDWKFTGTERLHAIFTPLDGDEGITRYDFAEDANGETIGFELETDFTADALFFEGDLGAIVSGFRDEYTTWDLPFAVGLMPLFFQNGVWMNDAFTGIAVSIPAKHSKLLNISNYDLTFFAGFDEINSGLVLDPEQDDVAMFGTTGFFEMGEGYLETGYAFVSDQSEVGDQSYHNISASFTRRYFGRFSNSVRLLLNTGQSRDGDAPLTADGAALFFENSLITAKPSTLIPYFNAFWVQDTPLPLAKAAAAGGLLSNVGILFESDGVTGQQILDATGKDSMGFAFGIEYLFDLTQQIVFEAATMKALDDEANLLAGGDQSGLGVRYQRKIGSRWLVRSDLSFLTFDEADKDDQVSARVELRAKF